MLIDLTVSAASIVAKETRDARLDSWVFPEQVRQQTLGTPALASAALATSGLSPAATGTKGAAASNVSAFSFSTQFGYVGVVVFSPIDNVPWVVMGVLHVLQSLWTSFFWACSVHFILVCLLSKPSLLIAIGPCRSSHICHTQFGLSGR